MRYQNLSHTNRVFDDIQITQVILTESTQELLTEDLIDDYQTVHLAEFAVSSPCTVTFTYQKGKVSKPKTLLPNRVTTFQELPPITSIQVSGVVGTVIVLAIAL